MINLKNTEVYGWEAAIRGMRNPMNSWNKSDSGTVPVICSDEEDLPEYPEYEYKVGKNDLRLMQNLSKAGSDHGKFLRYINVTVDITAPLYWWKEYDTYKVGTVANSCSTMHKIHAKEFTLEDFSHEHLLSEPLQDLEYDIKRLNVYRDKFLESQEKKWWWQMIQRLPSSYNQRRTVQVNYQVLKTMYHARKNHKLDEWHDFCVWCEGLPCFRSICLD